MGRRRIYLRALALALDAGLGATERAVKYSESFFFRAGLVPGSLLFPSARVAWLLAAFVLAVDVRAADLLNSVLDLFDWAISLCLTCSRASVVATSRRVAASDSRFCAGVRESCTFTATPSVHGFSL